LAGLQIPGFQRKTLFSWEEAMHSITVKIKSEEKLTTSEVEDRLTFAYGTGNNTDIRVTEVMPKGTPDLNLESDPGIKGKPGILI